LVARVLARTPRRLPRWRWWSPSCCCWSRAERAARRPSCAAYGCWR
jgi:hypothetical protein